MLKGIYGRVKSIFGLCPGFLVPSSYNPWNFGVIGVFFVIHNDPISPIAEGLLMRWLTGAGDWVALGHWRDQPRDGDVP